MSETKHTPTPWINRLGMIFGKSKGGCQLKEDEFMVAQIRGWGHLQYLGEKKAIAIQEANADYICHCVNTREALVAQRDALLSENNRLKEELEITQRWHDIKKELPQNKGLYCHIYIPSLNKNTTFKGWYHPKNKVWLTNTITHTRTNKVTHWKPITLPIAKVEEQP